MSSNAEENKPHRRKGLIQSHHTISHKASLEPPCRKSLPFPRSCTAFLPSGHSELAGAPLLRAWGAQPPKGRVGCPTCHGLYADSPGWAPGWCWWVSDYLGSPGGPQCQPPPPPPRSGAPRACSTPSGLGTPAGDRSEAEKRELCGGEGSPGPGGQQV